MEVIRIFSLSLSILALSLASYSWWLSNSQNKRLLKENIELRWKNAELSVRLKKYENMAQNDPS